MGEEERTVVIHMWLQFQVNNLDYTQDNMWLCTLYTEENHLNMLYNLLEVMRVEILKNIPYTMIHRSGKSDSSVCGLSIILLSRLYSHILA